MELLRPGSHGLFCEWKGHAKYLSLKLNGHDIPNVAWCYRTPTERFTTIAAYPAFYPSKMDECLVDGEHVQAQAGDFYGGWMSSQVHTWREVQNAVLAPKGVRYDPASGTMVSEESHVAAQIATASTRQASSMNQITESMNQIDRTTKQARWRPLTRRPSLPSI